MINNYTNVLKKYTKFSGRARRREYWLFFLANFLIGLGVGILILILSALGAAGLAVVLYGLSVLYSLAIILPNLALTVRRLHDTGRNWPWIFINFVPVVGGIWFFVLTVLAGDVGDNKYGPDPKK
ncbi:MAG: DUF805 domain-containing protein [Prevotellaceae bacterium]|jgi:uncharacterized membrane protein YhaH (DUF805 family)|nr:DUF805 domain-containing protein [Prevotellaceae bacterium]